MEYTEYCTLPHEIEIRDTAAYFKAVTFAGRGKYERHQFTDKEQAIKFACANPRHRPWGIYAITAEGRDAHIGNVA